MFKCVIVDDEPYAIDVLKGYIKQVPALKLVSFYTDPIVALAEIPAGEVLDFVFLDIDMPRLSGIELASAIRQKTRHIIYSTSFKQYGYEAFESGAAAYLLKPYSFARFANTVNKLLTNLAQVEQAEQYFFVKSTDDLVVRKIKYADIFAIESMQNYIKIHLAQQSIVAYMGLGEVLKALSKQKGFVQLHRSFIIAQKRIESINGSTVELSNGFKLNVGNKFKKQFSDYIANYLINTGPDEKESMVKDQQKPILQHIL